MEFYYENIKNNLYLKYINNLKVNSSNLILNTSHIENNTTSTILSESSDLITSEIKINNIFSENIDYLFLKPWNKLNQIHKVIKIKEFINNLQSPINLKKEEKEKLKEDLLTLIKNKKKNKILYDESKGNIISISALSFVNNKYIVEEK
jgi:hypothetical protein